MKELISTINPLFSSPGSAGIPHRVIQLLIDISHAMNDNLNLRLMLESFLETLTHYTETPAGTITLINTLTGVIELEMISGFPLEEGFCRHSLGETIIDKVIETGQAAVLLKDASKPKFLDPVSCRLKIPLQKSKPIFFSCVPIRNDNGKILGAIGAGRMVPEMEFFEDEVELLTYLAGILAPAVVMSRKVQERERRLLEEKNRLQNQIPENFKPETMVGNSHAFRHICRTIKQVAPDNAHILITGESGTGKELIAETIHKNSLRADKPFIRVNLESLPENLLETELFGAGRNRLGDSVPYKSLFEIAHGGTLYLDEISRLPISIQAKLFEAIQENEIRKHDETGERDVRILSSTSRNLEELVQHFQFRMDLYYCLNILSIHVPPLRERKSDIPLLANHFALQAGRKYGKPIHSISSCAMDMLLHYQWPGNVREMENYIDQAALHTSDGIIYGYHMPPTLQVPYNERTTPLQSLKESIAVFEKSRIADVLNSVQRNIGASARILGISERRLRQKMAQYQIVQNSAC
jgi:Nif-specific regulatory protein